MRADTLQRRPLPSRQRLLFALPSPCPETVIGHPSFHDVPKLQSPSQAKPNHAFWGQLYSERMHAVLLLRSFTEPSAGAAHIPPTPKRVQAKPVLTLPSLGQYCLSTGFTAAPKPGRGRAKPCLDFFLGVTGEAFQGEVALHLLARAW